MKSPKLILIFSLVLLMIQSSLSATSQLSLETSKPRIGVGVIVVKEGKILMGKRKGSHGTGLWAFPGGHLEFGESVSECATRELEEETGLKALSIRLGPWIENMMDHGKKHYITLIAIVDEFEGWQLLKKI